MSEPAGTEGKQDPICERSRTAIAPKVSDIRERLRRKLEEMRADDGVIPRKERPAAKTLIREAMSEAASSVGAEYAKLFEAARREVGSLTWVAPRVEADVVSTLGGFLLGAPLFSRVLGDMPLGPLQAERDRLALRERQKAEAGIREAEEGALNAKSKEKELLVEVGSGGKRYLAPSILREDGSQVVFVDAKSPTPSPEDYRAWLETVQKNSLRPEKPTGIPFFDHLRERAGFLEQGPSVSPTPLLSAMDAALLRALGEPTIDFAKAWGDFAPASRASWSPEAARAILAGAVAGTDERILSVFTNRDAALVFVAAVAALDTRTVDNADTASPKSLKAGEGWRFLRAMLDSKEDLFLVVRRFAEMVRDGYGLPDPHKDEATFAAAVRAALDARATFERMSCDEDMMIDPRRASARREEARRRVALAEVHKDFTSTLEAVFGGKKPIGVPERTGGSMAAGTLGLPSTEGSELRFDHTDSRFTTLSNGSLDYNIPKANLSKWAKLKPGAPGYLRSWIHGRNRYFLKSDLLRLSRSRPK